MNKIEIPYQDTGYFSKLISDYLDEKETLKPFYNHYSDINSFQSIIEERKSLPINRDILVKSLRRQYDSVEATTLTKSNIEDLNSNNCFTVTTGHQLNLFTGPLYFIYKIVSVINLAKELKANYPENNFVPVYWMATEDHDFEEINHFNLFKKRYQLVNSKKGAVGKMKLEGVDTVLSELKDDLGDRKGVEDVLRLFSKFYVSSATYTEAIKGIVNQLFGSYGLVIIDGDDAELKSLFADEFRGELINKTNYKFINSTSEKLKALGVKPQVNPREINIFYLKDNLRERIVFEGDKYKVLNTEYQFSKTEILEELKNNPERFSPNAPMRCMYQEKILPNLAYIGGGGELAYWFQLKAMFNENNISFPILVLRNSVLYIDKGSAKRILKLDLQAADIFQDSEELIKTYLKNGAEIILELKAEEKSIELAFDDMVKKAGEIDASLQPMIKAELQKSLKAVKNIEARLMKAEKQKEEISVNQIKNLKEKLFPNNSLQERHDNLISILLFNIGFIDELINYLKPLDKKFLILFEE